MTLELHLDLVPLAADLRAKGVHLPLAAAVDRAAAIGSIREDLRDAAASLRIIRQMQDEADARPEILGGTDDKATVFGALFTNAIILYARATFTRGARPALLGDDGLSVADKATHDEVKELRNSTFAHYGRGENSSEGPIVRDAVVRSFNRKQYLYGVYTSRALHKVDLGARMETLIDFRLSQVTAKLQTLLDDVETRLNEAASTDADLGRSLPRYEFDADRHCASPAAAAHLRARMATGEHEDTDYTTAVPKPSSKA